MPSLREQIREQSPLNNQAKDKETSKEESGKYTPTSPLGSKTLAGANADQAKMAGTPGQKQASLRQSLGGQSQSAGEGSLRQAIRLGQERSQTTAAEGSQISKASRLSGLAKLQEQSQSLASSKLSSRVPTSQTILKLSGDDKTSELLSELATTTDPNRQAELAELINIEQGNTTPESYLTKEELIQQFGDTQALISEQLSMSVGDNITAGDLDLNKLEYANIEELAADLGISVDELNNMSLSGMIEHVNTQIDREYDTVNELQNKLSDPFTGAAEKAAIRNQLKDMGATGIRGAESDMEQLADKIEGADTVEFLGEEMTISEMLDSDSISGMVAGYLSGEWDAETVKDFEENYGELANFIRDNDTALKQSLEDIGESYDNEFYAIQQGNASIGNGLANGTELDDGLKPLFINGYQTSETSLEPYTPKPILTLIKDNKAAADWVTKNKGTTMVGQLGNLTKEELEKLDIGNPNSDFVQTMDNVKTLNNPELSNDQKISDVFGLEITEGDTALDSLMDMVNDFRDKYDSGAFGNDPALENSITSMEYLVSKSDDTDSLLFHMKKMGKVGNISNLNAYQKGNYSNLTNMIKGMSGISDFNTSSSPDYDLVKGYDLDRPDSLVDSLDVTEINQLADSPNFANMFSSEAQTIFKDTASTKIANDMVNVNFTDSWFANQSTNMQEGDSEPSFDALAIAATPHKMQLSEYEQSNRMADSMLLSLSQARQSQTGLGLAAVEKLIKRVRKSKQDIQDNYNSHKYDNVEVIGTGLPEDDGKGTRYTPKTVNKVLASANKLNKAGAGAVSKTNSTVKKYEKVVDRWT